ncbi:alpha/beta fold hydrolase [Haladaptatus halobius]|uniref:alpha/beta fold hydrolase n=1 Tax=Haladaptatus halobius TaxID=2884875 RepID=UPI001D0A4AB3|nr:alpha/beta hydrolase [Haladaptatus halobius]
MILHGGGSVGEASFRYILSLSEEYKVIAPTLPVGVSTVEDTVKGLHTICEKEDIEEVHFLGFSQGGMIAQCFVRAHPELTQSLILFVSMGPSQDYAKKFNQYRTMIGLVPAPLFRLLSKYFITKQISAESVNSSEAEKEFWLTFSREMFESRRMNKELMLSQTDVLIDYFENYRFTKDDLETWDGAILIIEAENDRIVSDKERQDLKELYPQVKTILLENSGHFGTGLLQPMEIINKISEFVSNSSQQGQT